MKKKTEPKVALTEVVDAILKSMAELKTTGKYSNKHTSRCVAS